LPLRQLGFRGLHAVAQRLPRCRIRFASGFHVCPPELPCVHPYLASGEPGVSSSGKSSTMLPRRSVRSVTLRGSNHAPMMSPCGPSCIPPRRDAGLDHQERGSASFEGTAAVRSRGRGRARRPCRGLDGAGPCAALRK
jgi:hypothetical protein